MSSTFYVPDRVKKYGIGYILIGFTALALIGIFYNFSIPNTVGDETVLTAATLKMIAETSLRPDYPTNYHMPIGTYVYLPFFLVFLVALRLSGLFPTLDSLREFGILEYAKFLPLARFISVVLGAVSIYLVYRICQKLFGHIFISLLAAFLLATNVMFLHLSHLGKAWIPQIFVILLAFDFIVDLYRKEQSTFKDYFMPAVLTALSFGTHFIGIVVYLPFLVVHYLKNQGRGFAKIFITNKNLWLANGVIVLFILLIFYLNPYGFIHYTSYSLFSASGPLNISTGAGNAGPDLWRGVHSYWLFLFKYSPVVIFIFFAALIPLFRYRRDLFFIIGSFLAGYYFVIGPLMASRGRPVSIYIGPLIPFMAIIAAYGIHYFYYHCSSRFFPKTLKISALAALIVFSLYFPISWDYTVLKPSSHLLAREWIYTHIPSEIKIINFRTDLPLNENKKSISDIKAYAPSFFTKQREYLLSIDEADYPYPRYYVLTPAFYREAPPPEVFKQSFDYAVIGWHSGGYVAAIEAARPYGVREENLIRVIPEGATPDSFSAELENIWRPFSDVRKITHIGPVIAIYKVEK